MTVLSGIVGNSPPIVALRERTARLIERAATVRRLPPVLILGETGTGKGLLARTIQRVGPRAPGAFVEVNCAAIPENLLESEMFGVERGAFTDARHGKPGLFQTAHAGTLFLDEVGLLSEGLQGKLLKAIEDRVVRRVGGTRTEPADTWLLSATSVDLEAAVRERRFREDLYHRLAVFMLVVPPLRARGDDVLTLAEHFVARSCADYGLPPKTLSPEARAALLGHRWPGNVRELANMIERAVLLSDGERIERPALGLGVPSNPATEGPVADAPATLEAAVGRAEREHLRTALDRMGWNITRTAAELGISRDTLRYRIEKHGLRRDAEAAPVPRTPRPRPVARTTESPEAAATADAPSAAAAAREPLPPRAQGWIRRRLAFLRVAIDPPDPGRDVTLDTDRLVEKVEGFGARVEELGAASLLAVFGLDVVEDAPRRAAEAALAIRAATERATSDGDRRGRVRTAIHVAASAVTESPRGPSIDLDAKRAAWQTVEDLVTVAAPGEIVVSDAVVPFLLRLFEIASVESPARGGLRVYRVTRHERPELQSGRHVSPFVGRERELAVLLDAVDAAAGGRGQTIGVVGDAGLGKSRLVRELRARTAARDVEWLHARGVSYGAAIPYLPLRAMARAACGIEEGDDSATVARKARSALAHRSLDERSLAPTLLSFLGSSEGGEELAELSPQALRARVSDTLIALVVEISRARPVVFVVEDLHWIDPASEAWLATLAEQVRGAPMLFVSTYRPGYRPPWAMRSDVTQIALAPLGPDDSRAVVESVLAAGAGAGIRERIVDRAEGNPFFLEELARGVGDEAAPLRDVPVTIEDILQARIDRIPAAPRRLLDCAAVLGRAAPAPLLRALWDGGDAPDPHLRELARLEILDEHGRGEATIHVFRHALLHDVTYHAVAPARREALHQAAAGALERANPDPGDDVVDQLALHWSRAGVADKAVTYLGQLAHRSARIYAHAEAVAALTEAIRHVERAGAGDRDRTLVTLALRRAESMYFLGRFGDLVQRLEDHRDRFDRLDDPALSGPYHFWLALSRSLMGEPAKSVEHGRRALDEATRAGDGATTGKALYVLAYERFWSGAPAEGARLAEDAARHLEQSGDAWWLGYAWWVLGINHMLAGDVHAGLAAHMRMREIGDRLGDPRLRSSSITTIGACYVLLGEWDRAIAACRQGLALSPDPVQVSLATGFLAVAHLEKGDVAEAIPQLERAVDVCTRVGVPQTAAWYTALLAEARALHGQPAGAREVATRALEALTTLRYAYGVASAQSALARIALAERDLTGSDRWFDAARATYRTIGARYDVARTELDIARLAAMQGRGDVAARSLREALAGFEALGVPVYAERCRKLAVELGVALS